MKSRKIGLDKVNSEIAKLYLKTLENTGKYKIGEQVYVVVKNIKDKDFIFVDSDIGPGILPKEQLLDRDQNLEVNTEETICVFYAGTKNGENFFTTIPIPPYEKIIMENAKINQIPLKGKIDSILESGCYVKIGELLAFCPKSKLKKEVIKNEVLHFLVIEINQNNYVVSYTDYLQIQKEAHRKNLIQSLKIGSIVIGKVRSINNYGLSIDLGFGLEAFVPNSEISYKKTENISEKFKINSEVRGKIINLNWKEDKIIVSLKELEDNPWLGILPFKKGDILDVEILNIKKNGLLVKLNEGFLGFIPAKEISIKQRQLNKEFSINQKVKAMILQIQPEHQKITLSIKKAEEFMEKIEYQKYLANQEQEEETIGKILFQSQK
ncbi:MAG: S1 RNA-binding domain-containing protein [Leptonema sp. (in: bacteria)]